MSIPATMKAMVLEGHGGLDKIVWHEHWPTPEPGAGQVLIKVGACGLNNTDVNTRSGWYSKTVSEATTGGAYREVAEEDPTWGGRPISFPRIQGADTVGTIVALGDGVSEDLLNRRVMVDCWLRDWSDPDNMDKTGYFGSECNGGFAEYTVVDARNVGPIVSALSDAELATFSCSYTTAEGMLSRANVGAKDTVLVTGASGGVGSALVQLAKRRGATVIALASPAKHVDVKALGADHVLERAPADLKAALKLATGKDTVSVVADIVGGPYWGTLINALKRGGRYTCSGAIAGPIVELDLRTFYLRDLTFTGSTVIAPHIFSDVVGYIERDEIRPALAATYPLKDFHAAQTAFIEKKHTGNIVVTP
ncbi:alcohol dehydrogenase family protein [Roseibium alexandrii]|uniref:NADPH:quinone reductase n=1 Tax=Roseibium alexandrii (strain DSM 17067 / NCIMB 14079 / DFL-11) TaxID=244592 RepID=A0A5E8H335_ROSAD|nr:alcohol dehydrogenase family protein [Roseibium alexandrii]EEE46305.2 NADPH:quinone reductase [Roseibium alexandrii DFL-11]